jgi:probable phosphoglycerate mutase
MLEAQARIARWLHAAAKRHRGEAIAAVSHADVIKAGVAHVLGLSLHFYDRFEIAPGSSTTIVATEGGLRLITLNEAPHG